MKLLSIIFIILITYVAANSLLAVFKTLSSYREGWFVYEGQAMHFGTAFMCCLVDFISFGQLSFYELVEG